MAKRKAPPQSLYGAPREWAPGQQSPLAMWNNVLGEAARAERTVRKYPQLQYAKARADRLKQLRETASSLFEALLDSGASPQLAAMSMMYAARLGQLAAQIETDALYARAVRDEERKLAGFARQKKRPSDAEIKTALEKAGGRKKKAAQILRVSDRTLRRWQEK